MKKMVQPPPKVIDTQDSEISALKQKLTELGSVLNEVQAQRNSALDQAAQFGAIVMAMRRKYEPGA